MLLRHGQGAGLPPHVLVRAGCGVRDWGHTHQHFRAGLPAGLLLLPALWDSVADKTCPDTPGAVGLPDHVQRGSHHVQECTLGEC